VHVVLNLTAACDSLDNLYAEQLADEGSPSASDYQVAQFVH
jgi:hypothetical protein